MTTYTLIEDNPQYSITMADHGTNDVVIAFGGESPYVVENNVIKTRFFDLVQNTTCIFIKAKTPTWGQIIDFGQLESKLSSFINNKNVAQIGDCGGASSAVYSSQHGIASDVAILFSPVIDVNLPSDTWTLNYRDTTLSENLGNDLSQWKWTSVANSFNDTTKYYVFGNNLNVEKDHLDLIPNKSNINKIYFNEPTWANHYDENATAPQLSEALINLGIMPSLISACINKQSAEQIVNTVLSQTSAHIA